MKFRIFAVLIAVSGFSFSSLPASADVTAALTADTFLQAHTPSRNFSGGTQASALIPGQEVGSQIRWVVEGDDFFARSSIYRFELPLLPAGEQVTGARLSLWDTEDTASPDIDLLVGWVTAPLSPLFSTVTYLDVAPDGFLGGVNNFAAIDQSTQQINYDPTKVQFSSELFRLETPSPTGLVDAYVPYEDLTVEDGLAAFLAGEIDSSVSKTVHLILSPTGASNALALIHGMDSVSSMPDGQIDKLGQPTDATAHPKLEILTAPASAPQVPEPAGLMLLAGAGVLLLGRRPQLSRLRQIAIVVAAVGSMVAISSHARADLTATLFGETWVEAQNPEFSFFSGTQASGMIPGNEVGGQLRYMADNPFEFFARASIFEFELPAVDPGNVTGVRLSFFDTESSETPNANAQVGWITGSVPITPLLTYNDLAEDGFSGNTNDVSALDQAAMQIKYDPNKVEFSDQLANVGIPFGTEMPDPYPVYEDTDVADGLAGFVVSQVDPNQAVRVRIVLSPTGSSDMIALIHGSDSATAGSSGDFDDPIGNLADPAFYPKFEILTSVAVLFGDANKDGLVTGADIISVQQNFAKTGPTPLIGDANNDGLVTGADIISVQQNFGKTATNPSAAPLPEPTTLAFLTLTPFLLPRRGQTPR